MPAQALRHSVMVVAALLLCSAATLVATPALAVDPSSATTEGPAFGSSAWTYRDLHDADFKYEGGYARFDETATARFTVNPHGGYDTTTSRCSVCHASHRAEGAYFLMRAETQADACVYCHVGSAHSVKTVYHGSQGMYAASGHTIGAPSDIPASTTGGSLESTVLASTDASGVVSTTTVTVRLIGEGRNRMFRLRRSHTALPAGEGEGGYMRVGPSTLSCMSCHQVHGAASESWQPAAFPDNDRKLTTYKLLRSSPSGSIHGPDGQPYGGSGPATVSYTRDGMRGYRSYTDIKTTGLVNPDAVVRVPESRLVSGTTYGAGKTVWDSPEWRTSRYFGAASSTAAAVNDPAQVNQYAMSAWCADCHNAAIGDFRTAVDDELGFKSHESSRTHPAPFTGAGNGPAQCYTCHRGRLASTPSTAAYDGSKAKACERCHYGTGSYALDPARIDGTADFPHSADTSGAAMLGSWTVRDGSVESTVVTKANARDTVCARCHAPSGPTHSHDATVASETVSGTQTATWSYPPTTTMTYEDQACGSCHLMDVKAEHAKTSSSVGAEDCAACHTATRDSFGGWNRTCQQGGCHASFHSDIETRHAQTQPASCGGGGDPSCHAVWNTMDVSEAHNDAWALWQAEPSVDASPTDRHPYLTGTGSIPKNGCALCHTSPREPVPDAASTDCADCHAGH